MRLRARLSRLVSLRKNKYQLVYYDKAISQNRGDMALSSINVK